MTIGPFPQYPIEGASDLAARIHYWDKYYQIEATKVLPGEYFITTDDRLLVTVLGSCVAACVRDPDRRIGGMNHFMLPEAVGGGAPDLGTPARFGTYAMEVLIRELLKAGAEKRGLEAKIFGGGSVIPGMTSEIGASNAAFVRQYLDSQGIPVVGEDMLNTYPRKVYYLPRTGQVFVKAIQQLNNDTIAVRERQYRKLIVEKMRTELR